MLFSDWVSEVLLCKEPCDMRKSIDGLSILIADEFGRNPADGRIYVFMNKSCNKVKLIYWHKNGFCLLYKRLEKQRFIMPKIGGDILHISAEQFGWLLSGLDIEKTSGFKVLKYKHFY